MHTTLQHFANTGTISKWSFYNLCTSEQILNIIGVFGIFQILFSESATSPSSTDTGVSAVFQMGQSDLGMWSDDGGLRKTSAHMGNGWKCNEHHCCRGVLAHTSIDNIYSGFQFSCDEKCKNCLLGQVLFWDSGALMKIKLDPCVYYKDISNSNNAKFNRLLQINLITWGIK